MRVKNHTAYDSKVMRSVVSQIYQKMCRTEYKTLGDVWKNTIFDFSYARREKCPYRLVKISFSTVYIHIPSPRRGPLLATKMAFPIEQAIHRIMHKQWIGISYYTWENYLKYYEIPLAPVKEKVATTTKERQWKRYHALKAREVVWQGKLKRAENALKKIRKSLKYYDNVLDKPLSAKKQSESC